MIRKWRDAGLLARLHQYESQSSVHLTTQIQLDPPPARRTEFNLSGFGGFQFTPGLIFGSVLLTLLFLFTALRISGTSVAEFNKVLYDPAHKDNNLLVGESRRIRWDEWAV